LFPVSCQRYGHLRAPHSFPTRRSSDLVANVYEGAEDSFQAAAFNGKPAIGIDILKRPNANVIATVDGIMDTLPELRSLLPPGTQDRKSTRLNSSHVKISYAVFCLKKKN